MNKNRLSLFKTLLFLSGLIIIGIIYYFINYPLPEEGLTYPQKFFWIEIVFCYLIFYIPFFFSSFSSKEMDSKIPPTITIWMCIIPFEIISLILAFLSLYEIVPIKITVSIELILLFIAGIIIFLGYFAGNHIEQVQASEKKSISKINELKSTFDLLNLKTNMLSEDYFDCINEIKKICDDVKYLSPVDTELASSLETKLIIEAKVISESNLTPQEMSSKLLTLSNLVNQRKLQRN